MGNQGLLPVLRLSAGVQVVVKVKQKLCGLRRVSAIADVQRPSTTFLSLCVLSPFPIRSEIMKFVASMALAAAVSSVASATFVQYVVVKTSTTNSGVALDVYNVFARFNGATDTLLNAFNFNRVDGSATNIFYHKDNSDYNGGVLSKTYGTWAPSLTGSATLNRPFDSYLTIGGQAAGTNNTSGDPSWPAAGGGWNRADVPNGLNVGWFTSNPPALQGRVGVGVNTATDVRVGQFVVDAGADGGTWNLKIGYNSGAAGAPVQFAETTFSLPAPGALALLGLAGLAGRRRR
jgi:hypothetical protein